MDLVKLETAKHIFAVWYSSVGDVPNFIGHKDLRDEVIDGVVDAADRMCRQVGESNGHPAETALAQLFDLLADHHDDKLPKWINANAKQRDLKELCAYLGAERE